MADEQPLSFSELAQRRATENNFQVREDGPDGLFEGNGRVRNPTLGEAFDAALDTGLTDYAVRYFEERSAGRRGPRIDAKAEIAKDPLTSQRFAALPEEYKEKLAEAQTKEQLDTMLLNAEKQVQYQQIMQNAGIVSSVAVQIAAGFLDPTEVILGVATGGVGTAALKGRAVGRGVRAAVVGLEAGASNAAVTAAIGMQDPTIKADDVLAGFVVGGLIGAPIGAMGKGDNVRISNKINNYVKTVSKPEPGRRGAARTAAIAADGLDMQQYLRVNRSAESSGDDLAQAATSSAFGRYQFLKGTWVEYYTKTFGNTGEDRATILAKRADGATQDKVMQTFTRENVNRLRNEQLPVNSATAYLAHFLGVDRAVKVLKSPGSRDITSVLPSSTIKANASVFAKVKTVEDMVAWAARKMDAAPVATGGGFGGDVGVDLGRSASDLASDDIARLDAQAAQANNDFVSQPGSIGAAAREVEDVEYFGAAAQVPGSYARYLSNSVPAEVRGTFAKLMNSLSRKDNETREIAAETTARRIHDGWLATTYQQYNPHFREWAKGRGIGLVRQELGSTAQQEFMREVTRAMRGVGDVSPQAKAAGDALANSYKDALLAAKRANLPGFEDIDPNAKYVPRIINESKLMAVYRKVGMGGVQNIIRNALRGAGMDDELAGRVSKAYAEGSIDRAISPQSKGPLRGLADDDIERLRYYLPEDDPALVDDVISHLKNFRSSRNKEAGRIDRAKFRLDMDETAEIDIDGTVYSIADLFEDDAWQLFERYSRNLSGWIALSERIGIRSDTEWDQLVNGLKERHAANPKVTDYLEKLNQVKTLILGQSLFGENGVMRRTAQTVRKINFARTMGQAGMASLAELGNVIAYGGMKNMMMHMPLFRNFWRDARSGNLDKALVDEIAGATGIGMKLKLGRGRAGVDEFGDPIENHLFDTVDRMLDPFQRAVSYVGLLGPMNDFLQMLAARSFVQKLGNAANGKHKFSVGETYRLRDAGFHDGVLERALENIRQHGTFDGKRIVGLGLDKWDRQIAADFKDALANMAYRAVQENDIGSSAWWMHTGWGRMLTQFRSFVMNALVKQTTYAARYAVTEGRPDAQVWSAFALTMFFGGLSYTGRSYLNSFGQADPDEYREKRIGSVEQVALGAFNSTGYASILPGAVDTLGFFTGDFIGMADGPIFKQGRTTGLGSDFVTGNPTYDLFRTSKDAVRGLAMTPQEDYEFSQDDARKWQSLLPLNNVTGIRNMTALLNQELPEQSQEDEYWK